MVKVRNKDDIHKEVGRRTKNTTNTTISNLNAKIKLKLRNSQNLRVIYKINCNKRPKLYFAQKKEIQILG